MQLFFHRCKLHADPSTCCTPAGPENHRTYSKRKHVAGFRWPQARTGSVASFIPLGVPPLSMQKLSSYHRSILFHISLAVGSRHDILISQLHCKLGTKRLKMTPTNGSHLHAGGSQHGQTFSKIRSWPGPTWLTVSKMPHPTVKAAYPANSFPLRLPD